MSSKFRKQAFVAMRKHLLRERVRGAREGIAPVEVNALLVSLLVEWALLTAGPSLETLPIWRETIAKALDEHAAGLEAYLTAKKGKQ